MSLPKMPTQLLNRLRKQLPGVIFEPGTTFAWSPKKKALTYKTDALRKKTGQWSLLHEAAHARLNHQTYTSDFELLMLEVAAWQEAKTLATELDVTPVDEEYLQDCLDTYRDWLHRRSTCPICGSVGLQHSPTQYHCHNCHSVWAVTPARFCRPYRRKQLIQKETSPESTVDQTTFQ
jgi:hypothetical protein